MTRTIDDDHVTEEEFEGDSSDEEDEDEDEDKGVCEFCDNGGTLLRCEGECLRFFHTEEEDCESLGLSDEQVLAISNFYCNNCQYKQHQCFACGKLGSSDKTSAAVEVFRCVSGECGRFYHPYCVSKLLQRDNEAELEALKEKIANGQSFICPFHKCCVCNQGETEKDDQLRFAMCRRCPKSYHKKCLPREISFCDLNDEGIIQRAWEGVLPMKRILIYCLEHEIDQDTGTTKGDHVKFPSIKKKKQVQKMPSNRENATSKKKLSFSEDTSGEISKIPVSGDDTSATTRANSSEKSDDMTVEYDSLKKQKASNIYQMPLKASSLVKSAVDKKKTSHTVNCVAEETSISLTPDAESERRILALMKDASASIKLKEIKKRHKPPSTHSSKNHVDKNITLGKVKGSVEALHVALEMLEEGYNIEGAKTVCGPGLLSQMMKWENKLKICLAPFLHGVRYTSYDRHFTKLDKLKKIVDMLHCYAQDGDMIVDFSCGANDFSCLVKKKLDEAGKKCAYKNFDIIHPKNDFWFERRDWMSVCRNELPPGSKLIMGLTPPFGDGASLANQFIDKALEFRPKLIVLIVPPDTERLDKKHPSYDLILRDDKLLAGKSFYFPGSEDVNDEQIEQRNVILPQLYFWSRKDWTAKHRAIAQQQGHLNKGQEVLHLVESVDDHNGMHITDSRLVDNEVNGETSVPSDNHSVHNEETIQLQEKAATATESHQERLLGVNGSSEGGKNHGNGNSNFNEIPKKNRRSRKRIRKLSEISERDEKKRKKSPSFQSQPVEMPLKSAGKESDQNSQNQFEAENAGTGVGDISSKHDSNGKDTHESPNGRSTKTSEQFSSEKRNSDPPPTTKLAYRCGLLGFARGPYRPSENSSAGWIDE